MAAEARILDGEARAKSFPVPAGAALRRDVGDITLLIHRANGGEPEAWKHLLAELYEPLKQLARARLGSSRRSGTAPGARPGAAGTRSG